MNDNVIVLKNINKSFNNETLFENFNFNVTNYI